MVTVTSVETVHPFTITFYIQPCSIIVARVLKFHEIYYFEIIRAIFYEV